MANNRGTERMGRVIVGELKFTPAGKGLDLRGLDGFQPNSLLGVDADGNTVFISFAEIDELPTEASESGQEPGDGADGSTEDSDEGAPDSGAQSPEDVIAAEQAKPTPTGPVVEPAPADAIAAEGAPEGVSDTVADEVAHVEVVPATEVVADGGSSSKTSATAESAPEAPAALTQSPKVTETVKAKSTTTKPTASKSSSKSR